MPKLTSRLCLDLRSDGLFVFTCTRPAGHAGDHLDDRSDVLMGTAWPTHWPQFVSADEMANDSWGSGATVRQVSAHGPHCFEGPIPVCGFPEYHQDTLSDRAREALKYDSDELARWHAAEPESRRAGR